MSFPLKPSMWSPGFQPGHPLANGLVCGLGIWRGHLRDLSLHGNDGTLTGGASYTTDEYGDAVAIGRDAGHYIDCGSDASTDLTGDLSAVVIASVTTAINDAEFRYLDLFAKRSVYSTGYGIHIYETEPQSRLEAWVRGSAFKVACVYIGDDGADMPLNEPQQFAMTRRGGSLRLYWNGVEVVSIADAVDPSNLGGMPLRIGDDNGNAKSWGGDVGQFLLYNRELSAGEIAELYADPWGLITQRRREYFYAAASPIVVSGFARSKINSSLAGGRGRLIA